jgi:tetratricopeptide (TPR) repeat protein
LNPDYATAYFYRAEVKADMFDYEGALKDYMRTVKSDSNHHDGYIGIALTSFQIGDTLGSIEALSTLIERAPFYWLAFSNRGWLYYRIGCLDLALADLNTAIKMTSQMDPVDYLNRGLVKMEIGDFKGAKRDFTFSIHNGGPANAFYERGRAKLEMGKESAACRDFLKGADYGVLEAMQYFEKHCGR